MDKETQPTFSKACLELVLDKGEPTEQRIDIEIPEEGRSVAHTLKIIPAADGSFQLPRFVAD